VESLALGPVDQNVDITLRRGLLPCDRPEDADVGRPVASGKPENPRSLCADDFRDSQSRAAGRYPDLWEPVGRGLASGADANSGAAWGPYVSTAVAMCLVPPHHCLSVKVRKRCMINLPGKPSNRIVVRVSKEAGPDD